VSLAGLTPEDSGRVFLDTLRALGATIPSVSICVIFNGTAGGHRAERFRRWIDARRPPGCLLQPTLQPGAAVSLAAQAVRNGCSTLVAAGGDGTLNEVVNGLLSVPGAADSVRLGILPLGTVNVFAHETGIPQDLDAAWHTITSGHPTPVWLPSIQLASEPPRFFLQMAGAGLDASAVEQVNLGLKKSAGAAAYVLSAIKAHKNGVAPLQCAIRSHTHSNPDPPTQTCLAIVGNGRFYGGSLTLFPHASPFTGQLQVVTFARMSWLTLAGCTLAALCRRLHRAPGVRLHLADTVSFTANTRIPIQVDGDLAGILPAQITARAARLLLLTPRKFGV